MKELAYTNIASYERGKHAKHQKIEKHKNNHEIPRNMKMKKTLVTKEMTLLNLGQNIFEVIQQPPVT